jgi:Cation transporter/ATPase, N-terminus
MWSSDPKRVAIAGLATQDPKGRLDRFGPNEPAAAMRHSAIYDFLHGLANPLALILIIAAAASAFWARIVQAAKGRLFRQAGPAAPTGVGQKLAVATQ